MIETDRLHLRPARPEELLALIDSLPAFESAAGLPADPGLRDLYGSGEISPAWVERLRTATAPDVWTHGVLVVHSVDRLVIGTAGFKGPPDEDGVVEIAYGIAPSYQNLGYATEAAAALVAFAFTQTGVRLVRAHTRPAANASTRVLQKNGFAFIGDVDDPEDGRVWRWELRRKQDPDDPPEGGWSA